TATSTLGLAGRHWRFSLRLDPKRASLLRILSAEVGCPPSEVLRRSLDHYAASRSPRPPAPELAEMNAPTAGLSQGPITSGERSKAPSTAASEPGLTSIVRAALDQPPPTGPVRSFPREVLDYVAQYRSFGAEVWPER